MLSIVPVCNVLLFKLYCLLWLLSCNVLLSISKSSIGIFLSLAQRIPLDFLEGEKFREAADNYMRPLLTKVGESFLLLFCSMSL